jgi:hypothetical protein
MYLITLLLCLVRSWKKRGRKIIDLIMAYLEILEFMWAAVAFNSLCLFFFKTIYIRFKREQKNSILNYSGGMDFLNGILRFKDILK